MTLNMTDAEMQALEKIASDIDASKTTVMRRALRLYQEAHVRISSGETMHFSGDAGRKVEIFIL